MEKFFLAFSLCVKLVWREKHCRKCSDVMFVFLA